MSQDSETKRELIDLPDEQSGLPFSSVAAYGNLVFTSGALPKRADGSVPEAFAEQVEVALENLHASLQAAGVSWDSVLKINGFVADIEKLPVLNEVYLDMVCSSGRPARTTVEVSNFRGNVQVEFDAIAIRLERKAQA